MLAIEKFKNRPEPKNCNCGGVAKLYAVEPQKDYIGILWYSVACTKCGKETKRASDENLVIEWWDRDNER